MGGNNSGFEKNLHFNQDFHRGWGGVEGSRQKYSEGIFETGSLANPVRHPILLQRLPLQKAKISTHGKATLKTLAPSKKKT